MLKIIEDTRQKESKHDNIGIYLSKMRIHLERKKLQCGDYMIDGNNAVSVDTKQSLSEICMDLGSEQSRFRREMIRANELGIKLIVLIEDGRYKNICDVQKWKNPNFNKSKICMSGKELAKRMRRSEISYGVSFKFCKPEKTGECLLSILLSEKGGDRL